MKIDDIKAYFHDAQRFLFHDLWELEFTGVPLVRRMLLRILQVCFVTVKGYLDNHCLVHAAALTFTTMLMIVPFVAFVLWYLDAQGMQYGIKEFLMRYVSVDQHEHVERIVDYIKNTKFSVLGRWSMVFLIMCVLAVMSKIERTFNQIWGVRKLRPYLQRLLYYTGLVAIVPVLIVASSTVTASMQLDSVVTWLTHETFIGYGALFLLKSVLPYVALITAFFTLYFVMPNTRVKVVAALVGAVVSALGMQALLIIFVRFSFGMTKYNLIYGALAPIPIMMMVCYAFWAVVLLGGELSYAVQNASQYDYFVLGSHPSFAARLETCLTLMGLIARWFDAGEHVATPEELSRHTNLPPRLVRDALGILRQQGLIVEVNDHEGCYHPARSSDRITVAEIVSCVWNYGEPPKEKTGDAGPRLVAELQEAQANLVGARTIREFGQEGGEG